MKQLLALIFSLCALTTIAQRSDSSFYHTMKADQAVLDVYYHIDYYPTGYVKSEGWVYKKEINKKIRYGRVGLWKEYSKRGLTRISANYPVSNGNVHYIEWDEVGNKLLEARIAIKHPDEMAAVNLKDPIDPKNYSIKYFLDNKLESVAQFKNGDKHGNWRYFDRSGTVYKEEVYLDGALLSTRKM